MIQRHWLTGPGGYATAGLQSHYAPALLSVSDLSVSTAFCAAL